MNLEEQKQQSNRLQNERLQNENRQKQNRLSQSRLQQENRLKNERLNLQRLKQSSIKIQNRGGRFTVKPFQKTIRREDINWEKVKEQAEMNKGLAKDGKVFQGNEKRFERLRNREEIFKGHFEKHRVKKLETFKENQKFKKNLKEKSPEKATSSFKDLQKKVKREKAKSNFKSTQKDLKKEVENNQIQQKNRTQDRGGRER